MNDHTKKTLEEMAESMNEILDTITSIKGEDFAEMVRLLHLSTHTGRLFRTCIHPELSEHHIDLLFTQYGALIDCALNIIAKHSEMSETEFEEMAKWAEIIDDRVVLTLSNLNGD